MIKLCCHYIINESEKGWAEKGIFWATVALAIITLVLAAATGYLVREAKKQLIKIKEFVNNHAEAVKKDAAFNQGLIASNEITKQIEFHYKIFEGIALEKTGIATAKGYKLFQLIYNDLSSEYEKHKIDPVSETEKILASFQTIYNEHGYLIGHYYRNLYRIFKKISETKILGFDNNHYAKLVRAQLSEYEVSLLFYNCIWIKDDGRFKKLAEQYGLFEGMNYSHLFNPNHKKDLYKDEAFGDD